MNNYPSRKGWGNPSGRTMALGSVRNEYHEYFLEGIGGRCVGLTILLPSHADCMEIWEPHPLALPLPCKAWGDGINTQIGSPHSQ